MKLERIWQHLDRLFSTLQHSFETDKLPFLWTVVCDDDPIKLEATNSKLNSKIGTHLDIQMAQAQEQENLNYNYCTSNDTKPSLYKEHHEFIKNLNKLMQIKLLTESQELISSEFEFIAGLNGKLYFTKIHQLLIKTCRSREVFNESKMSTFKGTKINISKSFARSMSPQSPKGAQEECKAKIGCTF